MPGAGWSPALATGVSGDFPGVLPFCPTYRLALLDMSEIILKGTESKKKNTMHLHTNGNIRIDQKYSPDVDLKRFMHE